MYNYGGDVTPQGYSRSQADPVAMTFSLALIAAMCFLTSRGLCSLNENSIPVQGPRPVLRHHGRFGSVTTTGYFCYIRFRAIRNVDQSG